MFQQALEFYNMDMALLLLDWGFDRKEALRLTGEMLQQYGKSNEWQDFLERIVERIRWLGRRVVGLQERCRVVIRGALRDGDIRGLDCLPLPIELVRYLWMEDFEIEGVE